MKTPLIAVILSISVTSFAQTFERQAPPLSAQDAITRAAKYVIDKKIDVSKHFVSSIRYMESGALTSSSIGKGPYWQVTYELVQLSSGGEHFILIYMDGKTADIRGR